jgi:hypothetical protein
LLYILLLIAFPASSQTLQGVVTDAGTGHPLYPVTVINIATQQVTYTDSRGFYSIAASQGDVIAFTYIGYKSVEKPKPLSVIVATLNVSMTRTEYGLQEVKIRPGHLSPYQIDSLERVSIYKVQLQRRPPSPFVSPVSAIAEKFSRRAKRTYQFQKDFMAGEIEKFVDTRYTIELVQTLTGLSDGDSTAHFMNANPMPYDFARTATDLELKMWIRDHYKQWKATQN